MSIQNSRLPHYTRDGVEGMAENTQTCDDQLNTWDKKDQNRQQNLILGHFTAADFGLVGRSIFWTGGIKIGSRILILGQFTATDFYPSG